MLISAFVAGGIGFFQYFGLDIWQTAIGKFLITPLQYQGVVDPSFISRDYSIYSTMYNSNNVGSYFAMLFPISLVLFTFAFAFANNSISKKYATIFSLLMFMNLLGSRSRAGWLGAGVAVFFFFIIHRHMIKLKIKEFALLGTLMLCLGLVMNIVSAGDLSANVNIEGATISDDLGNEYVTYAETKEDGSLYIETNRQTLRIAIDDDFLVFHDIANQVIDYALEETPEGRLEITLKDHNFDSLLITFEDNLQAFQIEFTGMRNPIPLALTNDGIKGYQFNHELVPLGPVESFGFDGYESLGSGRGYIFSRTLPLLKDTILIGKGPDTFTYFFPQHDLVGKANFINVYGIVDKPHNFFLQVAFSSGIISLISILGLFAIYFVRSLYTINTERPYSIWSITASSSFLAFIGYAFAGFFNDSMLAVSPVFFILLGLGMNSIEKLRHINNPVGDL
ncbi:O-Antigen ligase [Tindallia magadiensis]|uniref:O-Antigen ligase n=1 Tax=Tindallia magadiensis TaxID=69895 RepID=A0A1I3D0Z8_9FIRM|nr:O-antigen ligase family protein [Tindallia magadiensis]SFH80383.1 O-Antigen ligase [Tindallia magadiensis]